MGATQNNRTRTTTQNGDDELELAASTLQPLQTNLVIPFWAWHCRHTQSWQHCPLKDSEEHLSQGMMLHLFSNCDGEPRWHLSTVTHLNLFVVKKQFASSAAFAISSGSHPEQATPFTPRLRGFILYFRHLLQQSSNNDPLQLLPQGYDKKSMSLSWTWPPWQKPCILQCISFVTLSISQFCWRLTSAGASSHSAQ